jgi:hypothetical protein
MEDKKISVMEKEQVDNSIENLFYNRILDILSDPNGPQTCKLLSELSTKAEIEDGKNV